MNRRKFITYATGVLLTETVNAMLVKSNYGAKNLLFIKEQSGISAKSYINDGLFAMWDGIENVGWGIHNSQAITWKDLVGNHNARIKDVASWNWTNNSFCSDNQTAYQVVAEANGTEVPVCMEICYNEFKRTSIYCFIAHTQGAKALSTGSRYVCIGAGYPLFQSIGLGFNTVSIEWSPALMYANGISISQVSGSDTWYSQNTLLQIGYYGNNRYPFWGEIFCIRMYNRQLTIEEKMHNYEIDKQRFII